MIVVLIAISLRTPVCSCYVLKEACESYKTATGEQSGGGGDVKMELTKRWKQLDCLPLHHHIPTRHASDVAGRDGSPR